MIDIWAYDVIGLRMIFLTVRCVTVFSWIQKFQQIMIHLRDKIANKTCGTYLMKIAINIIHFKLLCISWNTELSFNCLGESIVHALKRKEVKAKELVGLFYC